ncbi:hypothetical protein EJD97_022967 [Solanum chilense]|uniref:Chromo domain-containing protein n=1 Tax=Solanum chilense TaxID=4083 RepID=A0A6N2AUY7_SOLCI|nr:hypothetical protein EJD97_022967 [Solanum chilense]
MKGIMRLYKKETLSSRCIGSYRNSRIFENVPYELELPKELEVVHPVFNIPILKKYLSDPSLIVPTENVGIKDILPFEEIQVLILDRKVCKLRTKEAASVKVLWRNKFIEEATWEAEEDMKKKYPHLFESGENADQGTKFFS